MNILYSFDEDLLLKVEINNDGDLPVTVGNVETCKPQMWLQMGSAGNVTITNETTSQIVQITGLAENETIWIDFEREMILTDLAETYRQDNIDTFDFELDRGTNIISIDGDCEIAFKVKAKYLA